MNSETAGVVNAESFSIPIDGSTYSLAVTVVEDGDWMVWTFDFPVEEFIGDGNLNVGLIIATDGEGEGPAFQIHNNDGATGSYPWGTWMYGSWGPTIDDGWFGWPNHDLDVPIEGNFDWVEAIGQRNTPWEGIVSGDGVMEIRIKKSELGESFHWAASPTVGTGFWEAYDVTMQIPTAFSWSTPLVDMDVPNYILVLPTPPTYSCVGFDPPMDRGAVSVRKNRVLPLKAELLDDGVPVTDADISTPPVIQVIFQPTLGDAVDVTDDALSAGFGTDGNQFESRDDKWQFNLKTKLYTGSGTYTVTIVSGDEDEYTIDPTCEATFVIP